MFQALLNYLKHRLHAHITREIHDNLWPACQITECQIHFSYGYLFKIHVKKYTECDGPRKQKYPYSSQAHIVIHFFCHQRA